MSDTCPVCGKGEYVDEHTWCHVSHLACVGSQREESLLMKARYQECEYALAALIDQRDAWADVHRLDLAENLGLRRFLDDAKAELAQERKAHAHDQERADHHFAELAAEYDDGEDHIGKVMEWVADCETCRLRSEACMVPFHDPDCEDWEARAEEGGGE